jgi:hypothetical protein
MADAVLDSRRFHIDAGRVLEELLITINPVFPQEPKENGPGGSG